MSAPATVREAEADPRFAKMHKRVLVRLNEVEGALRAGAFAARPGEDDVFSDEPLVGSLVCEVVSVPLAQRASTPEAVREAEKAGTRAARRGGKLRLVGPILDGREALFIVLVAPRKRS